MAKVESPFVISPHKYQELAQPVGGTTRQRNISIFKQTNILKEL